MPVDLIEQFIDVYVDALRDNNAAIFAGAGLSIPAGFVDWKKLMRGIAADLNLSVDKESDLVTLAQYHVNEFKGRHKINQILIDEFAAKASVTKTHQVLANLPIQTFWTTNYDTLIEDSLRKAHKKPDVKIATANLATTVHNRDAVVYKMHGDVSLPHEAVVTKEDYETFSSGRQLFSTALQGDLVSKTFLFIGFSFNDPNLSYILGRIRALLGGNVRHHYCLIRRVARKDFGPVKEFHYAQAKQELQIRDLRRYGIIAVVADDYSQYADVIDRLAKRYKRSKVFISGSAASYSPFSETKGSALTQAISRGLVKNKFGVVSGGGLGIGPHVVNGALEQFEAENTRAIDDRLTLRPFPAAIADPAKRKLRWTNYRKEILREAGIAIFLFGNKLDADGNMIKADGVEEEFRIAAQMGIPVIPVGATGHVAADLHAKVLADFDKYYPSPGFRSLFVSLGRDGSANQIASRVIRFVEKLQTHK